MFLESALWLHKFLDPLSQQAGHDTDSDGNELRSLETSNVMAQCAMLVSLMASRQVYMQYSIIYLVCLALKHSKSPVHFLFN